MFLSLSQFYINTFRPKFKGTLSGLLYRGTRVKIGRHFTTDSIPKIIVDKNATLTIGDNVELKRNVEIRVHGTAKVIIGNNVRLDRGIRILAANNATINIGTGTRIGLYTVLNGGDSITVGNKVLISGFVYLQTSMHGFAQKELGIQDQGYSHAPVVLQDDVWLGTHVVIMPGCNLGKGVVAGSNAVVTQSFPDYTIIAGVPAKVLKERG